MPPARCANRSMADASGTLPRTPRYAYGTLRQPKQEFNNATIQP
ncbi:hypothetical protein [Richelia sinica]|nr:hypothetical protein [Richelia sinica]